MSPIHRSPITNLIRINDVLDLHQGECETIIPYPANPWEASTGELNNDQMTREEAINAIPQQIEEEKEKGARIIFTDGSLLQDGGGEAAVSPSTVRSIGCPAKNVTNNSLELLAIALAVAEFKQFRTANPTTPNRLAIFSDSQTALKHVNEPLQPRPMQYLARSVKTFIQDLGDADVKLFWVPGHESIEDNEAADKAAKEAAEVGATKAALLPMSLSKLAQETRSTYHRET